MRREESERKRHDVFQLLICSIIVEGKSLPLSMIQETVRDKGGGEKSRAPRAEYEPPPPKMSNTGGLGGR